MKTLEYFIFSLASKVFIIEMRISYDNNNNTIIIQFCKLKIFIQNIQT
jgi:hypothetical protein